MLNIFYVWNWPIWTNSDVVAETVGRTLCRTIFRFLKKSAWYTNEITQAGKWDPGSASGPKIPGSPAIGPGGKSTKENKRKKLRDMPGFPTFPIDIDRGHAAVVYSGPFIAWSSFLNCEYCLTIRKSAYDAISSLRHTRILQSYPRQIDF